MIEWFFGPKHSPVAKARKQYFFGVLALITILALGAFLGVRLGGGNKVILVIFFIFLLVMPFLLLGFNMRCPRCGWQLAIGKTRSGTPIAAIGIPNRCPNCALDLRVEYSSSA
ncbi:MAG: hypothetical protein AB7S74_18980 [Hyphomicrobium sp.]